MSPRSKDGHGARLHIHSILVERSSIPLHVQHLATILAWNGIGRILLRQPARHRPSTKAMSGRARPAGMAYEQITSPSTVSTALSPRRGSPPPLTHSQSPIKATPGMRTSSYRLGVELRRGALRNAPCQARERGCWVWTRTSPSGFRSQRDDTCFVCTGYYIVLIVLFPCPVLCAFSNPGGSNAIGQHSCGELEAHVSIRIRIHDHDILMLRTGRGCYLCEREKGRSSTIIRGSLRLGWDPPGCLGRCWSVKFSSATRCNTPSRNARVASPVSQVKWAKRTGEKTGAAACREGGMSSAREIRATMWEKREAACAVQNPCPGHPGACGNTVIRTGCGTPCYHDSYDGVR